MRAQELPELGRRRVALSTHETKVRNHRRPIATHQEIRRLEVAVDDAGLMHAQQAPAHIDAERARELCPGRTVRRNDDHLIQGCKLPGLRIPHAVDKACEGRPIDPLHGQTNDAVLVDEVEDLHQVGVLTPRQRRRLSDNTNARSLGQQGRRSEQLERDKPAELGLFGQIDDPRCPAPEFAQDVVTRDALGRNRLLHGDSARKRNRESCLDVIVVLRIDIKRTVDWPTIERLVKEPVELLLAVHGHERRPRLSVRVAARDFDRTRVDLGGLPLNAAHPRLVHPEARSHFVQGLALDQAPPQHVALLGLEQCKGIPHESRLLGGSRNTTRSRGCDRHRVAVADRSSATQVR